jgi:hypothetical protein
MERFEEKRNSSIGVADITLDEGDFEILSQTEARMS